MAMKKWTDRDSDRPLGNGNDSADWSEKQADVVFLVKQNLDEEALDYVAGVFDMLLDMDVITPVYVTGEDGSNNPIDAGYWLSDALEGVAPMRVFAKVTLTTMNKAAK